MKKYLTLSLLLFFGCLSMALGAIPRSEYPRPQFERPDWVNLNGAWDYALDPVLTGWERNLKDGREGFTGQIIVPFAPETRLSGVEHKEFIPCIWYSRSIRIPQDWAGRSILLNFGAVYYVSEVYIDGAFVGRHYGGSDSFSLDITSFVQPGKSHTLVVNARSDLRGRMQPSGKQALQNDSYSCNYTRTTGIWQTVWMEAVHPQGLERVRTTTDIDRQEVSFVFSMRQVNRGNTIEVEVLDGGKTVARALGKVSSGTTLTVPLRKARLWSPESPFLYDVRFTVRDAQGRILDAVSSYFGMRKIHSEGNRIYLNNEPYYQRLVLDQGFYPEGSWTAPSDEALRKDIEMSMAAGFNGARLHQKVFEERFYYWADHLGYLTWGEAPSWGMDANSVEAARNFMSEWRNILVRDMNHPSIVTWTPFNEEFWPDEEQYPRFVSDVYDLTKQLDPSRLVNDVSGGVHIKTDIWTEHDYEQDAEKLRAKLIGQGELFQRAGQVQTRPRGNIGYNFPQPHAPYSFLKYSASMPYILDEFGGIKCMEANPEKGKAWGYGEATQTREDFYRRLESQVRMLIGLSSSIWGYCYTQLTDVEQEQNGIYYYDRTTKYDMERIRGIFQMPLE